jgi:hypothetical protein
VKHIKPVDKDYVHLSVAILIILLVAFIAMIVFAHFYGEPVGTSVLKVFEQYTDYDWTVGIIKGDGSMGTYACSDTQKEIILDLMKNTVFTSVTNPDKITVPNGEDSGTFFEISIKNGSNEVMSAKAFSDNQKDYFLINSQGEKTLLKKRTSWGEKLIYLEWSCEQERKS